MILTLVEKFQLLVILIVFSSDLRANIQRKDIAMGMNL